MRYKKTVWVIDIFDYLTYLEECLDQLAPQHPWLRDTTPIDKGWSWMYATRANEDNRTQRDYLVDWIVRQQIHEVFFMWATNHHRNWEHEQLYNQLRSQFSIDEQVRRNILIPNFYGYGDLHPGQIWRQSCWLYIECEVLATVLEQYAISPNATA